MIKRTTYLNWLLQWQDHQIIKVITGIRRCGKSTLLKQFQDLLMNNGVKKDQIIDINFEDMDFEDLLDYHNLYKYIKNKIIENQKMYIFLDEIQKVKDYENVVDSLYIKENIDIYITGSNSYIFSGQLATNLRGRYIELSILPLSFKEYYEYYGGDKKFQFRNYLKIGSFPYLININHNENINLYMEGIYNTVLLKDIEDRLNRENSLIKNSKAVDITLLKSISKYLSSVTGSQVSIRSITNYLISNERKISPNTVSDYVQALCDAYLYYPVETMNISGKELLKSNKKYYIVDLGIRNYILPKKNYNLGFSIENIVFLELLRRGYEIYVGKNVKSEVDFIVKKNNEFAYIQVSASIEEESTFKREITPLKAIDDNYPKTILTLDELTQGNYNGIKVKNVIDWLLE